MQACRALEEAHATGIIHRDLKPHNLFLTRVDDDPDFVKLLDFGIARLRDPAGSAESLTWTGVVVGTPSYLAPELWQGSPADQRSDAYALGATLHYLVSGAAPSVRPTQGVAGDGDEVQHQGTGHSLYELELRELRSILARCLATSPENRYQSARELYDALERVYDPTAWTRAEAEDFWRAVDRRRFGSASARDLTRS